MTTARSVRVRLMWPTAYRFGAGHRVRVQVSSGSHPVYVRNLGTGEPLLTATAMQAADQAVYRSRTSSAWSCCLTA